MSTDPKKAPPGKAPVKAPAKAETLEDAVYKTSLTAGNKAVQGANPWVSIPVTAVIWIGFGWAGWYIMKQTGITKKLVKAVGVTLTEDAPPGPARGRPRRGSG
ncbi:MAG TPA: hypothetical protein VFF77_09110, partial [Holophagaceae bacterium]|nr:hypothetical protein [Holophagaceae bacterium]